jgi:hypothetical protein
MNDVLVNTYLLLAINLCFENCCVCLGHTISLLWSLLLVASLQICLDKLKTNIYVNSRVVSGICQSTNCLSKGWGLKPWKLMSLSPTSRLVLFFFLRHLLLLYIAYLFHNLKQVVAFFHSTISLHCSCCSLVRNDSLDNEPLLDLNVVAYIMAPQPLLFTWFLTSFILVSFVINLPIMVHMVRLALGAFS